MKHENRSDTVIYLRLPRALLRDLDALGRRERAERRSKDPYAQVDVSRSELVRRAVARYVAEFNGPLIGST